MDRFDLVSKNEQSPLRTFLDQTNRYHLPLLIILAVAVRLPDLTSTDRFILGWRPTDLASIALNYYRHGFDFFFPQVHWGGNGPGYVEMEFPLLPFMIALAYKAFGIHDWVAIVIPFLSGIGLVVCTYLLARLVANSVVAVFAGIIVAVSPALIPLTTELWPDPPMVFLASLSMFELIKWTKSDSWVDLIVGAISASLAILLKLTALYILVPIFFLYIHKYRRLWWTKLQGWILLLIVVGPPVLWYWHSYTLYRDYHNTFGILTGGYMKFGTLEILFSPSFYSHTVLKLATYHLGIFASAGLAIGLFLYKRFHPISMRYWLASCVLYVLVAARGIEIGHYQYLLPVLTPCAVLSAEGLEWATRRLAKSSWTPTFIMKNSVLLTIVLLSMLASSMFGTVSFRERDQYAWPLWEKWKKAGVAAGRVTEPGSLIIVSDPQMDQVAPGRHMTPPDVFYFSDRRGWYMSLSWLTSQAIDSLRNMGAKYFVVPGCYATYFAQQRNHIEEYLSAYYTIVMNNEDAIIYELQRKK